MGYVSGFTYDVFVSYASIDNEISKGAGWVEVLVDKLHRQLTSRLGTRDLKIFFDREAMSFNLPISSQLVEAARRSATLLVVMSPGYVKSQWCDRERRAFLDVAKDRVAAGALCIVHMRPVDRNEQPEEFRDLSGVKFFALVEGPAEHRVLGIPDPDEPLFVEQIDRLCGGLARQLEHAAQRSVGPAGPPRKRVFVAPATDDLEECEAGLRSYLEQAGLEVLPALQSRYPMTDLAAYEAAVLHDLESCCLFAQVLSAVHGKDLPFAPGKRLPVLHQELARRANLPVLQWRERDVVIEGVRDAAHRALLEAAQACGIEEFKHTVADRALHPPAPPPEPPPPGEEVLIGVFVDADARDHALALQISEVLAELGVFVYRMPEKGPPADIRIGMDNNLLTCNGYIFVYGKTEFHWVQAQLQHAQKVLGKRAAPPPMMAVFEGPPSDKVELGVTIKSLEMINCREGVDPERLRESLRQFVARLRK